MSGMIITLLLSGVVAFGEIKSRDNLDITDKITIFIIISTFGLLCYGANMFN